MTRSVYLFVVRSVGGLLCFVGLSVGRSNRINLLKREVKLPCLFGALAFIQDYTGFLNGSYVNFTKFNHMLYIGISGQKSELF